METTELTIYNSVLENNKKTMSGASQPEMETILKGMIPDVEKRALSIVINTDEDKGSVVNMIALLKSYGKFLEERRKMLTKPLMEKKAELDAWHKGFTDKFDNIVKTLSGWVLAYERKITEEQEAERQRIEKERLEFERQQEELKKLEIELPPEYVEEKKVEIQKQTEAIIDRPKTQSTNLGFSSTIRKRWTYEVVDLSKVPVVYMQINSGAIRDAINTGVRDIAGIRIYQEESLSTRN